MGMNVGSAKGGRNKRRKYGSYSEINVTPLVDVMLVLLVIFMVTAPMMTVAVPVDLPKTQAKNISSDKEPLVISIKSNGDVYLMETKTELSSLVARLQAITGTDPEARIFVRGDQHIDYGRIMEVMGTVSAAGFNKVALIAELPPPPSSPRATKKR